MAENGPSKTLMRRIPFPKLHPNCFGTLGGENNSPENGHFPVVL